MLRAISIIFFLNALDSEATQRFGAYLTGRNTKITIVSANFIETIRLIY